MFVLSQRLYSRIDLCSSFCLNGFLKWLHVRSYIWMRHEPFEHTLIILCSPSCALELKEISHMSVFMVRVFLNAFANMSDATVQSPWSMWKCFFEYLFVISVLLEKFHESVLFIICPSLQNVRNFGEFFVMTMCVPCPYSRFFAISRADMICDLLIVSSKQFDSLS